MANPYNAPFESGMPQLGGGGGGVASDAHGGVAPGGALGGGSGGSPSAVVRLTPPGVTMTVPSLLPPPRPSGDAAGGAGFTPGGVGGAPALGAATLTPPSDEPRGKEASALLASLFAAAPSPPAAAMSASASAAVAPCSAALRKLDISRVIAECGVAPDVIGASLFDADVASRDAAAAARGALHWVQARRSLLFVSSHVRRPGGARRRAFSVCRRRQ